MTSTNDGKDVKSNQTSGPKGKSYYIELYKFLEARLSEGGDGHERTKHLCVAWRSVHSLCQHSAPSTHTHLLNWLHRHTARAVLQTEWQTPKRKDDRKTLEEAIDAFIGQVAEASRESSLPWEAQIVARGEWFKRVLDKPWDHPVLTLLLNPNGTPPTDDEVLAWLAEERGVMFVARLHALVGQKCDDIAASLAAAVMDRARASLPPVADSEEQPEAPAENAPPRFADKLKEEAGFTPDVWETLTDIEFVLLHKRDSKQCIALAKQTPLLEAYPLIERLHKRLEASPREKRLWKNAREVAILIAQVVIARCMVVKSCVGAARTALYCCARLLARLLVAGLPAAADALAAQALTARHLHTLAQAVDKQLSPTNEEMKPYVCELYVRAITAGMNELERLKLKTEKETEARSMEKTLASWFVQLGAVLARSDRIACECALTAFSLHPSQHMYERIDAAPPLAPLHTDTNDPKEETVKSEFGSWANDSRSQTNLVKTSETLNLKHTQNQANVLSTAIFNEGEALGLSPELCQDIAVLLSGPRVKTLSWDMDRTLLLENCRAYSEMTHEGTRVLTRELKYLNIDPRQYQHLPEEKDDDENDPYYGIERGYEHLAVLEEPEEIWENPNEDPEKIESSSSIEKYYQSQRRKKKTKKEPLSSDEDSDPLSYVAEAKRTQKKKERPHSKERSKQRKKKPEHVLVEEIDPLNIDAPDEDKEKMKPKKEPKIKKERKKKEKVPKVIGGKRSSLASLVGIKIKTKKKPKNITAVATPVADSDNDIQAKNSLTSANSQSFGPHSVNDGSHPRPEHKDHVGMPKNHSRVPHMVGNKSSSVERPLNNLTRMQYRPQTPTAASQSSASFYERTMYRYRHYPEDIRDSISRFLLYRQQREQPVKTTQPTKVPYTPPRKPAIIQQDIPLQANISPKGVAIPEIPKSFINKEQAEKMAELSRERNVNVKDSVIQFARKNVNKTSSSLPESRNKAYHSANSMKMADIVNPSYDRLMIEIAERHRRGQDIKPAHSLLRVQSPKTVQFAQRPVQKSMNVLTAGQKDFQNFLKEREEQSRLVTTQALDMSKSAREPKKSVMPVSRVIPVVPHVPKPEQKPLQCPKQPVQKKPDLTLNTFSRLNYHKNKQNELKNKATKLSTYQEVSSELDEIIKEHQLEQLKVIQAKRESMKAIVPEPVKKCGPVSSDHPLLANLLLNSPSTSNSSSPRYENSAKTKLHQSFEPPKSSNLSEKDNNDLLNLLWQQNKLSKYSQYYAANVKSKPSTSNITKAPSVTNIYNATSSQSHQQPSKLISQEATTTSAIIRAPIANIYNPAISQTQQQSNKVSPAVTGAISTSIISKAPSMTNIHIASSQKQSNKPISQGAVSSSTHKKVLPGTNNLATSHAIQQPSKPASQATKSYATTLENNINVISNTVLKPGNYEINKSISVNVSQTNTAAKTVNCTYTQDARNKVGGQDFGIYEKNYIPESSKPEWQAVMFDLLRHKTPTRGPNALDVALNKSSFASAFEKSVKEASTLSKSQKHNSDIEKNAITKKSQNKADRPKPLISSIQNVIITKKGIKLQDASKQHKDPTAVSKFSSKQPVITMNKSETTKKLPQEVQRKQFTYAGPKQGDPFISGIPNSDYDLLEELMDDDLRKEIGELSSDEESYNAAAQSFFKSTKSNEKRVSVEFNKSLNEPTTAAANMRRSNDCQSTDKISPMTQNPALQPNKIAKTPLENNSFKGHEKAASKIRHSYCSVASTSQSAPTNVITASKTLTNNQMMMDPNIYISNVRQQAPAQNIVLVGQELVYGGYKSIQTPIQTNTLAPNAYVAANSAPTMTVYQRQFAAPMVIGTSVTVPMMNNVSSAAVPVQPSMNDNMIETSYPAVTVEPLPSAEDQTNTKTCDTIVETNIPDRITDCSQLNHKLQEEKANERKVLSEVQDIVTTENIDKSRNLKSESNINGNIKKDTSADMERLKKKRLAIINRDIYHRCGETTIPLEYAPLLMKIETNSEKQDLSSAISLCHTLSVTEDKSVPESEDEKLLAQIKHNLQDLSDAINDVPSPATPDSNDSKENKSYTSCRRILLRSSNKITPKINAEKPVLATTIPKKSKAKLKPEVSDADTKVCDKVNQDIDDKGANAPKRASKRLRNKKSVIAEEKIPFQVQQQKPDKNVTTLSKNVVESKLNQKIENENLQYLDIESTLQGSKISKIVTGIKNKLRNDNGKSVNIEESTATLEESLQNMVKLSDKETANINVNVVANKNSPCEQIQHKTESPVNIQSKDVVLGVIAKKINKSEQSLDIKTTSTDKLNEDIIPQVSVPQKSDNFQHGPETIKVKKIDESCDVSVQSKTQEKANEHSEGDINTAIKRCATTKNINKHESLPASSTEMLITNSDVKYQKSDTPDKIISESKSDLPEKDNIDLDMTVTCEEIPKLSPTFTNIKTARSKSINTDMKKNLQVCDDVILDKRNEDTEETEKIQVAALHDIANTESLIESVDLEPTPVSWLVNKATEIKSDTEPEKPKNSHLETQCTTKIGDDTDDDVVIIDDGKNTKTVVPLKGPNETFAEKVLNAVTPVLQNHDEPHVAKNETPTSKRDKAEILPSNTLSISGDNKTKTATTAVENHSVSDVKKLSEIPQSFKDSIRIENLSSDDPMTTSVRISLPNGRKVIATVRDKVHVTFDTLFAHPAIREALLNENNCKRRYVMNIQQIVTVDKSDPNKILSAHINQIDTPELNNPDAPVETIDLLSDDEDSSTPKIIDTPKQEFVTEYGTFCATDIEKDLFIKHQNKLSQKTRILLKKLDAKSDKQGKSIDSVADTQIKQVDPRPSKPTKMIATNPESPKSLNLEILSSPNLSKSAKHTTQTSLNGIAQTNVSAIIPIEYVKGLMNDIETKLAPVVSNTSVVIPEVVEIDDSSNDSLYQGESTKKNITKNKTINNLKNVLLQELGVQVQAKIPAKSSQKETLGDDNDVEIIEDIPVPMPPKTRPKKRNRRKVLKLSAIPPGTSCPFDDLNEEEQLQITKRKCAIKLVRCDKLAEKYNQECKELPIVTHIPEDEPITITNFTMFDDLDETIAETDDRCSSPVIELFDVLVSLDNKLPVSSTPAGNQFISCEANWHCTKFVLHQQRVDDAVVVRSIVFTNDSNISDQCSIDNASPLSCEANWLLTKFALHMQDADKKALAISNITKCDMDVCDESGNIEDIQNTCEMNMDVTNFTVNLEAVDASLVVSRDVNCEANWVFTKPTLHSLSANNVGTLVRSNIFEIDSKIFDTIPLSCEAYWFATKATLHLQTFNETPLARTRRLDCNEAMCDDSEIDKAVPLLCEGNWTTTQSMLNLQSVDNTILSISCVKYDDEQMFVDALIDERTSISCEANWLMTKRTQHLQSVNDAALVRSQAFEYNKICHDSLGHKVIPLTCEANWLDTKSTIYLQGVNSEVIPSNTFEFDTEICNKVPQLSCEAVWFTTKAITKHLETTLLMRPLIDENAKSQCCDRSSTLGAVNRAKTIQIETAYLPSLVSLVLESFQNTNVIDQYIMLPQARTCFAMNLLKRKSSSLESSPACKISKFNLTSETNVINASVSVLKDVSGEILESKNMVSHDETDTEDENPISPKPATKCDNNHNMNVRVVHDEKQNPEAEEFNNDDEPIDLHSAPSINVDKEKPAIYDPCCLDDASDQDIYSRSPSPVIDTSQLLEFEFGASVNCDVTNGNDNLLLSPTIGQLPQGTDDLSHVQSVIVPCSDNKLKKQKDINDCDDNDTICPTTLKKKLNNPLETESSIVNSIYTIESQSDENSTSSFDDIEVKLAEIVGAPLLDSSNTKMSQSKNSTKTSDIKKSEIIRIIFGDEPLAKTDERNLEIGVRHNEECKDADIPIEYSESKDHANQRTTTLDEATVAMSTDEMCKDDEIVYISTDDVMFLENDPTKDIQEEIVEMYSDEIVDNSIYDTTIHVDCGKSDVVNVDENQTTTMGKNDISLQIETEKCLVATTCCVETVEETLKIDNDVSTESIMKKYLALIRNKSEVLDSIVEYEDPEAGTCYVIPIIEETSHSDIESVEVSEIVIERPKIRKHKAKTETDKQNIANSSSLPSHNGYDDIEAKLAEIVGESYEENHSKKTSEIRLDEKYETSYSVEVESISSPGQDVEDIECQLDEKITKESDDRDSETISETPPGARNISSPSKTRLSRLSKCHKKSKDVSNIVDVESFEVTLPKHTYSKVSEKIVTRRRSLKRKIDMSDTKTSEKKYRKGKNIDYPRFTAASLSETVYAKEYKTLIDYCSAIKFSFAVPFHKEYIDVHNTLQSWPIEDTHPQEIEQPENQGNLFDEIEKSEALSDPLKQTLPEEIISKFDENSYTPSNIQETNFKMGFGEGSGRVIQQSKDGEYITFSAATLSDVKPLQPLLPSDEKVTQERLRCVDSNATDQKLKATRFIDHLNLREKVRSFFEKTKAELSSESKRHEKDDFEIDIDNSWPFGDLTSTRCFRPAPVEVTVNVVQVGQLPVSAAAQNPVTCDPRVTHVSNASPSQCSPGNSLGDELQTPIKTEYTELTTADITLPLMQEYVQHHSMPSESQEPTNLYNASDNTSMSTQILKSVVKIELMDETSQDNEEDNVDYENSSLQQLSNGNVANTIQYQFENIVNNATSESDPVTVANSSKNLKPLGTFSEDKQCNERVEKPDQLAHAMNAAGISATKSLIKTSNSSDSIQHNTQTNVVNASQANNFPKTTVNAIALQQALAQILPPPLNQTSTENNQLTSSNPQVLHIVQGNNTQSVINKPNGTQLLHIVQNKSAANTNGTPASQQNAFSGLSLVDSSIQQGGNQLLHIVNTGNQKNTNAGQLLKRVNLLTNLANVQGSNEQKMVQFVCKSADGKSIQLPHQRSMVLRLQPLDPSNVPTAPKQNDNQEHISAATTVHVNEKESSPQEMKSRSLYEENYAKFVQNDAKFTQNGDAKQSPEKSTSLPKFNQVFGKQVYQDKNDIDSETLPENADTQEDNNPPLEQLNDITNPPMLIRKTNTNQPTHVQPNLVQQIKQTIGPMNIQTMHGGVIYTRQIPVNIGNGQTINLITVPSTELVDDSAQKQQNDPKFINQEGDPPIIKIVPTNQPGTAQSGTTDDNNGPIRSTNDGNPQPNPQPQPVLTQMRIKLPMLSKAPQMVGGTRVVRPSFFQIQRNVIGGANQQVFQQLVLTAAPPLGQSIRLPAQVQKPKTPSETQSSPESQMSSSTLEQLREFDMVLEQVKERSTVQPGSSTSTNNFTKLKSPETTDAPTPSTSTQESPTQVLYSVGNTQPLNIVNYVNRKSTITSTTTSSFVRSPDSTGTVESPSSSTHSHLPHTVTSDSCASSSCASEAAAATVVQPKPKKKKPKPSTSTSNPFNIKNTPKPSSQKPLEDEQTTQRILYILAEYKEQVENSPDKDKPAPRRRNNPAAPNAGSSKRKKSSSGSRRRDMSPVLGEDSCRTMGSEDSSCGTSLGECNECLETHSPEESPKKVARRLTFEQETQVTQTRTTTTTTTTTVPQRNVIVTDGQAFAVRGATGKPATTVLMPANYLLPVSMVKGGQQIAIVTNRGPKLLVGAGEGGTGGTLLFQRLIGPGGLKPMLARPGVRHIRLPTAALHNLQAFNIATPAATNVQPSDSTASPAPAPTPPDLVDTRAMSSPWPDRDAGEVKPERGNSSPEGSEPWNLPSSSIADDYGYEEIVRTDNMDRTVLDAIPDRYSPDLEAQRIFDKMFDSDSKKSMYDSRCGYDIDASDDDKAYHQVVHRKDGRHTTRLTHVSAAALRHKYAILEHELRLQKSLSEECEDLGVDSPSASELFPEAELLFAPSPAHEQTIDQCHTPQPMHSQGIPQPDLDDQIATDHLLTHKERHDDLDINLDDVGEIVTVGEDGMTTIPLDHEEFARSHEEFARSHPNTTFHSEPEDGEVPPFTIAQGVKGRQITFHSRGVPGTVVMAPQTTVISQATIEASGTQNPVKFSDLDNMINAMPSPQHHMSMPSVLKESNESLTKFDRLLNESRELNLTNTASAIVHSTGNGTQVIRRVQYERRDSRYLVEEDAMIAGDSKADDRRDILDDTSSSERHPELFWDTQSRPERKRFDFSSDSDKCCKSPYDETNSDSSGIGAHTRLDSVIKAARTERRRSDGSSAEESHPPLRTYPPKRTHQHSHHSHHHDVDRSVTGKTRASDRCHDNKDESRRRASNRGVVKRGCHCCNGSATPKPKKSRPKKSTDYPHN